MGHKIVRAWGAAYLRQMLIALAAMVVILPLACLCLGVPLYVVQNGNYDSDVEFLILLVPILGFGLLVIGGSLGLAVFIIMRRARELDAAFTPLGLAGRLYLTNGRQYHGTFSGRPVDAYFYRGPTLDLYLGTPLKTRLSLGAKDRVGQAIAGWFNYQPVTLPEAELNHLSLYALDEAWARGLLSDPNVKAAILRLTAEATDLELRQVHFQPEALLLRLYHTDTKLITADHLRQWLGDLQALARAAEAIPPPKQTAEASALERNTRSNRGAFVLPAIGLTLGLVCLASVCALVPVLLILSLEAAR